MKTYFFVSDTHSFYTPLMTALHNKGFDEHNQDHILVVLGDIFDRGYETLEVYKFLKSLPKERCILIYGNHEHLYFNLLTKRFPDSYDFSNGTVRTFCQIACFEEQLLDRSYWYKKAFLESTDDSSKQNINKYANMPYEYWRQILEIVEMSDITKWLKSDAWINYFETPNYICVHSWIPSSIKYPGGYTYFPGEEIGYRDDWRNATDTEWNDATWGCPWRKAKLGWNKTNKTIMCGHWHTSDFFNNLTKQKKQMYDCPIFKSKRYKLIGLDACTAGSNKVNVLVLNEDEL